MFLRLAAMGIAGALLQACGGLGPDGKLRIDGYAERLIPPVGGCHPILFHPLAKSRCGQVNEDRSYPLNHPLPLGPSGKLVFRVPNHNFKAVSISVITDLDKNPFKVLWTHTYDGHTAEEDFSSLAPGIYVVEVFVISDDFRNTFYRFGINVGAVPVPPARIAPALPFTPPSQTPEPAVRPGDELPIPGPPAPPTIADPADPEGPSS